MAMEELASDAASLTINCDVLGTAMKRVVSLTAADTMFPNVPVDAKQDFINAFTSKLTQVVASHVQVGFSKFAKVASAIRGMGAVSDIHTYLSKETTVTELPDESEDSKVGLASSLVEAFRQDINFGTFDIAIDGGQVLRWDTLALSSSVFLNERDSS